jgi:hypothetical protein
VHSNFQESQHIEIQNELFQDDLFTFLTKWPNDEKLTIDNNLYNRCNTLSLQKDRYSSCFFNACGIDWRRTYLKIKENLLKDDSQCLNAVIGDIYFSLGNYSFSSLEGVKGLNGDFENLQTILILNFEQEKENSIVIKYLYDFFSDHVCINLGQMNNHIFCLIDAIALVEQKHIQVFAPSLLRNRPKDKLFNCFLDTDWLIEKEEGVNLILNLNEMIDDYDKFYKFLTLKNITELTFKALCKAYANAYCFPTLHYESRNKQHQNIKIAFAESHFESLKTDKELEKNYTKNYTGEAIVGSMNGGGEEEVYDINELNQFLPKLKEIRQKNIKKTISTLDLTEEKKDSTEYLDLTEEKEDSTAYMENYQQQMQRFTNMQLKKARSNDSSGTDEAGDINISDI